MGAHHIYPSIFPIRACRYIVLVLIVLVQCVLWALCIAYCCDAAHASIHYPSIGAYCP